MIDSYKGNLSDIKHFLKVYTYARTPGLLEGLDEKTREVLEIAAIVHDIAAFRGKGSKAKAAYLS